VHASGVASVLYKSMMTARQEMTPEITLRSGATFSTAVAMAQTVQR
jgi:hypothetical protein